MNHKVLAPSYADACSLKSAIDQYGWHARIVRYGVHIGVIVFAPRSVMSAACKRAAFSPGRTVRA